MSDFWGHEAELVKRAQRAEAQFHALRVAAQALVNQMTDHPHEPASWFDHEIVALDAALKEVG